MYMCKNKIEGAVYGRHYVCNFHFHLIWCTKYRNQTFTTPALAQEIKDILSLVAEDNQVTIEAVEVMPDHIHLMISFLPSVSASNVVKVMKGRSAAIFLEKHPEIRKSQYWGGNLWSPSYYIGSCGNMSKETVEKYIAGQHTAPRKRGRPSSHD